MGLRWDRCEEGVVRGMVVLLVKGWMGGMGIWRGGEGGGEGSWAGGF